MVKDTWRPVKAGPTGRGQSGSSCNQSRLPEDMDFWTEFYKLPRSQWLTATMAFCS